MISQQNKLQYFILILILLNGFVTNDEEFNFAENKRELKRIYPEIRIFQDTFYNEKIFSHVDKCYNSQVSNDEEIDILCLSYLEMIRNLNRRSIYKYTDLNELNKAIRAFDEKYPDGVDNFCSILKNAVLANHEIIVENDYRYLINDVICNEYCITDNLSNDINKRYSIKLMCKLILLGYELINHKVHFIKYYKKYLDYYDEFDYYED